MKKLTLLERTLCAMGFHAWFYTHRPASRHCRRCAAVQILDPDGRWITLP